MNKSAVRLAFLALLLVAGGVVALNWDRWNQGPALGPADLGHDDDRTTHSSTTKAVDLPLLAKLPDFELTDIVGATLNKSQLAGRALLISFLGSEKIADHREAADLFVELNRQLKADNLSNDVRLLSIVVADDPSGPAARAVADLADNESWKVASARQSTVQPLQEVLESISSGASSVPLADQVFLVDPQGDLRARYVTNQMRGAASLRNDVQLVLDERVLLVEGKLLPKIPNDLINPAWLARRKEAQLKTVDKFQVFHDFSFHDRRPESGIRFRNRIVDDAGRMVITAHYDHGNGIAVADVDGDQLLDIYFVNQVGPSQLWKNLGGGKFEDITEAAGVALKNRIGVTATFADTDNDGDADLYVTTVRSGNVLFENDGHGVFRDVTIDAGLKYVGHSSGAVFFDYDRDGLLDLFLVNVGHYTTDRKLPVVNDRFTGPDQTEYRYYVSNPDAFAAHLKPDRSEASVLYRNLGKNQFEDVSAMCKLNDLNWTGDATAVDLNVDGWPDLYVVCMQGHDEYYQNVEGRYFERRSREVFPATPWGSMGIKAFDFDNDGDLDIYVTDMHTDMQKDVPPAEEDKKIPREDIDDSRLGTDLNHIWGNAFFVNQGNGQFVESSDALGTESYWPWGFSVADLNADGFDDIFVTASMSFPFRYATNRVLLNNQGQHFLSSEFILGVEPRRDGRTAIPWFELDAAENQYDHPICQLLRNKDIHVKRAIVWGALGSRSSVIFDMENDGDLDVITNDFNAEPMVLESNLSEKNTSVHFLNISLVGRQSNRDGLGATVRVRAGGNTFMKVNDGKSGYLSQSRMPLYFGLGDHTSVESIEVTWPSGKTQTMAGPIEMNTAKTIEEEP